MLKLSIKDLIFTLGKPLLDKLFLNNKPIATEQEVSPADLLKRAARLEIKGRKLSNHRFSGEYYSAFKGNGLNFKEVKEYSPGDDVRFIDWNVSARMGNTYTKVFDEEREQGVYLLIDASSSTLFGSNSQSKWEVIQEIAALLASSANKNNDKVGLVVCSDTIEHYLPAKKGKNQLFLLIRTLLLFNPLEKSTGLGPGLRFFQRMAKHKSTVFIISDFVDKGYGDMLRQTAKKHDVIGIFVKDGMETGLPNIGIVLVEDWESGKKVWIDTGKEGARDMVSKQFEELTAAAREAFKKANAPLVEIDVGGNYVKALQGFFHARNRGWGK